MVEAGWKGYRRPRNAALQAKAQGGSEWAASSLQPIQAKMVTRPQQIVTDRWTFSRAIQTARENLTETTSC